MLQGWVMTEQGQILFVSDADDLLAAVADYRHSRADKQPEFNAQQIMFGVPRENKRVTLFGAEVN